MSCEAFISVGALRPQPIKRVPFAWTHFRQVPEESGCYVLTNFVGQVLYVGQATSSIRDRFCVHLETREKRVAGALGVPYWCYFLLHNKEKLSLVEQGWINQSILSTGARPPLNKIDAPA